MRVLSSGELICMRNDFNSKLDEMLGWRLSQTDIDYQIMIAECAGCESPMITDYGHLPKRDFATSKLTLVSYQGN